jgi:predicted S18 family serine protease
MELHMKRIAAVAVILSLAAAPAFAQSTKMSEAQLDQVTGGLLDVSLDNVGNPSVQVTNPTVTVSPTVSVSVLGGGLGL